MPTNNNEISVLKAIIKNPKISNMDIAMPTKHDIDAILKIKVIDPEAKIIGITALYSSEKWKEVIDVGVMALVMKPFEVPELIVPIEKVLAE